MPTILFATLQNYSDLTSPLDQALFGLLTNGKERTGVVNKIRVFCCFFGLLLAGSLLDSFVPQTSSNEPSSVCSTNSKELWTFQHSSITALVISGFHGFTTSWSLLPPLADSFLHPSRNSLPTRRGQATHFQWRTMASNLEEMILIPVTSHLAANRPIACCRSWLEGASKTTLSAKRTEPPCFCRVSEGKQALGDGSDRSDSEDQYNKPRDVTQYDRAMTLLWSQAWGWGFSASAYYGLLLAGPGQAKRE
ncbi:hypothetical protein CRENBAI_016986 [Crenichthys baileyi]|uniref:Uncharacterized protein n=1 Tax=Crenichthys baileyi TaxID=28760 RepID=A0AAV9R1B3_9TELE